MEISDFIIGQIYNRRRDIHAHFQGQMQGGISTPASFPIVFVFTGTSGARHGYVDEWTADGTFRYFGEGQEGDMALIGGNKAIAEHITKGKDLLLFETLGKGQVRYKGMFNCAAYKEEPGKDRNGENRQALVFYLKPLEGGSSDPEIEFLTSEMPSSIDLMELREKAKAAACPAPKTNQSEVSRSYFLRSKEVYTYVLARAKGICESCNSPSPFKKIKNQVPYLEPHHIRRLTDGGPDDPRCMGAICPNCHREIHHGMEGKRRNKELQKAITAKELVFDKAT